MSEALVKYSRTNKNALQATCNGVEVGHIEREFHGPHPMYRVTMDEFNHVYRTPKLAKRTLEARVKVIMERSEK